MTDENIVLATSLFDILHGCPELSGHEKCTKQILIDFINKNTSMEVQAWDGGLCAIHREVNGKKGAIAIRADYDALEQPDGSVAHLCGHDGHAASLCLVALALENKRVGRDVYLLFQSAEETGEGAKKCLDFIGKENIAEIYGAHNLPGFSFGQIFTRFGTFACGSCGLSLSFRGKATHAAYPELGVSPAMAVGEFLTKLQYLVDADDYQSMTLCTVIGVSMGEKAFGAAAANADIWLTLRAEEERNLVALKGNVIALAEKLAGQYKLAFSVEEQDVFPATENDGDCVQKVMVRCNGKLLLEPMRWSEDFGHYLQYCRGAYFGIGAGEDCAALHTSDYCYPKELIIPTATAFLNMIK